MSPIKGVKGPGKRSTIPLSSKLEILRKVDANPHRPKTELAAELGLNVSTLKTIIKNRARFENAGMQGCKKRKKVRGSKFATLENALVEWINQARGSGIPINGTLIREKSKTLALRLGFEGFTASNGWYGRFRCRNQVLFKGLCGESAEVDEGAVEAWTKNVLPNLIRDYEKRNIYNADEFGLFYNMLPDKTMTTNKKDSHGMKQSKARVTVLLCANADGSEKINPLVIGKSQKPRCFANVRTLPCDYSNQAKAWMTGDEFILWLKKIDGKMRAQRRKIILFVDNCAAHPKALSFLTNVRVEFLPKNTTSRLQPLDQGIIRTVQHYFRQKLVRRLLNKLGEEFQKKDMFINLYQAMHFLQWAWSQVTLETISNCFRKAGFVQGTPGAVQPRSSGEPADRALRVPSIPSARVQELEVEEDVDGDLAEVGDPDEEDSDMPDDAILFLVDEAETDIDLPDLAADISERWDEIVARFDSTGMTFNTYFMADDDIPSVQPLSLEEIADKYREERPEEESVEEGEDDDGDALVEPQTLCEGIEALERFKSYLCQLPNVPEKALELANQLGTLAISSSIAAKKQSKIDDFFPKV